MYQSIYYEKKIWKGKVLTFQKQSTRNFSESHGMTNFRYVSLMLGKILF